MAINGVKQQRILINHHRMPYRVAGYKIKPTDVFCIVSLRPGKYFRVLHIATGLTMTDTSGFEVARVFIHCLRLALQKSVKLRRAFKQLAWQELMDHIDGSNLSEEADKIVKLVRHYNNRPGHVSHKVTADCKFGPRVEYLR